MKNRLVLYGIVFLELLSITFFIDSSPDYFNYINLINRPLIIPLTLSEALNYDFLFYLIIEPLKMIGLNAESIIFIVSSSAIIIKNNIFYKLGGDNYISFFYGISLFWIFDLIQLRLSVASTFLSYAFLLYKKEKFFSYYLSVVFAILSHASFAIFLLLNLTKNLGKWALTIMTIAIIAMCIINANIFTEIIKLLELDRIDRYLVNPELINMNTPGVLSSINLLSLLLIFFFLTIKNAFSQSRLFLLLVPAPCIALASVAIGFFIPVLAIRTSQLMFLPVILSYSLMMHKFNISLRGLLILTMSLGLIYSFPIKHFLIT